jgi:hypothetical protein
MSAVNRSVSWVAVALAACAVVLVPACGARDADSGCADPTIEPHLSPVNFGDLYPAPADGSARGGSTVPKEWALLLRSKCSKPVAISKVCLVGDAHNGVKGSPAFYLEGPEPAVAAEGADPAVRITYNPGDVNADLDGDGLPDPDNVALVVQSNAKNFPTLVVPLCARLVAEGTAPATFACASPVTVAAGSSDPSLCP